MEKKDYLAPRLMVVSFRAERGIAVSTPIPPEAIEFWYNQESQMEAYETQEGWQSGGDFWN